jgi:hypothetical protein
MRGCFLRSAVDRVFSPVRPFGTKTGLVFGGAGVRDDFFCFYSAVSMFKTLDEDATHFAIFDRGWVRAGRAQQPTELSGSVRYGRLY